MPLDPNQTLWLVSINEEVLENAKNTDSNPYLQDENFNLNHFAVDFFDVGKLSNDTPFWVCDTEMKRDIITHHLIPNTFSVRKFRSLFDLIACDNELYIGCKQEVNQVLTDEEHASLRRLNGIEQ